MGGGRHNGSRGASSTAEGCTPILWTTHCTEAAVLRMAAGMLSAAVGDGPGTTSGPRRQQSGACPLRLMRPAISAPELPRASAFDAKCRVANIGARNQSGHQAPAAARHAEEEGWAAGEATGLFYLYYQPLVPVAAMVWAWAGLVALFEARAVQYGVCFSPRDQQLLPPARALYHVIAPISSGHISCALVPRSCAPAVGGRACLALGCGTRESAPVETAESAPLWRSWRRWCRRRWRPAPRPSRGCAGAGSRAWRRGSPAPSTWRCPPRCWCLWTSRTRRAPWPSHCGSLPFTHPGNGAARMRRRGAPVRRNPAIPVSVRPRLTAVDECCLYGHASAPLRTATTWGCPRCLHVQHSSCDVELLSNSVPLIAVHQGVASGIWEMHLQEPDRLSDGDNSDLRVQRSIP